MKIDTLVKRILNKKKKLTDSCKVCVESIDFWEKRSNKLFDEMDEVEEEFSFSSDEYIEDKCTDHLKEVDLLMNRMKFENDQLDLIEKQIEELETELCLAFAQYAKKQKK
tara:strand:- start:116 stop:445 length:330 start_codon:yes stop_codon:yes gene_type:complete